MYIKWRFLILVVLPVFLGFFVYLYFREGHFLYEKIFNVRLQKIKLNNEIFFYYWLKFSFPDAAYIFSISNWFLLSNKNKTGFWAGCIFYIILMLVEILQLIFANKIYWIGTYDILDLYSYSLGYGLSLIIMNKYRYFVTAQALKK